MNWIPNGSRGSPHVHSTWWIRGAPNLDTTAGRQIAPQYIHRYISVNIWRISFFGVESAAAPSFINLQESNTKGEKYGRLPIFLNICWKIHSWKAMMILETSPGSMSLRDQQRKKTAIHTIHTFWRHGKLIWLYALPGNFQSVSYTHLTLPTIYSV